MQQQQALINGQNLTATYVVDGSSLSPFPVAPTPIGDADTTAIFQGAAPAQAAAVSPDAVASTIAAATMPAPRRRSVGFGLFTMLFALFAKALPLMLVLGGGYYTYSYFFGTPPMVEMMRRKLTGEAEPTEEAKPKSRAAQMMNQTRDVVAANDQRINFANALADESVDLDSVQLPSASPSAEATIAGITQAAAASVAENDVPAENAPAPKRRTRKTQPTYDTSDIIPGRIYLPSPVEPSVAFIVWVDHAKITGLRAGSSVKIQVNDLTVGPGDILDHALGIVVEDMDPATSIVRFRDKTGAIVGKRF